MQFFSWLESTGFAQTIGQSIMITASLSAVHVIGFTLVMSAAVVWNLRASGILLRQRELESIARPAIRLLGIGLAISVITGLALFAPRASYTATTGVFQLKLALIVIATCYQLVLHRLALSRPGLGRIFLRAGGAIGLLLWLSLAVTACWFILFE